MRVASGSNAGHSRRNGVTRTMCISRLVNEKKNARSRVCRRASAFSHIQPSPRKKIAGKPSRSARKSAPRSATGSGVENNHAEETKDRLGWKHACNPDNAQGAEEAAETHEKTLGRAAQEVPRGTRKGCRLHQPLHR